MNSILVLAIAFLIPTVLLGQDYFDDANNEGLPIHISADGSLFSARANLSDNSIKVNFFKFFNSNISNSVTYVGPGPVYPSAPAAPKIPAATTRWGAGINLKGKTEQNIGSLFSSGVLAPGFTGGGYGVRRIVKSIKDPADPNNQMNLKSFETILFSLQYSASSYRLYDDRRAFDKMKIDSAYNGFSIGLSWFKVIAVDKKYDATNNYLGRVSNLIFGASVEIARKNNFNTLDQYEIKDYFIQVSDPTSGMTRIIQIADDAGYGYSKNEFKVYNNVRIRPHINYIPGAFNHRIGAIFYPSIDFNEAEQRYNLGLGINLLEKDIPSLSTAGVFFELNDLSNSRGIKNKTFLERSFNVSIAASFNMITGKQR